MDIHHKIVTWVHLGLGALGVGVSAFMVLLGTVASIRHADGEVFWWLAVFASMWAVLALPWLVGGWALLKGRDWGRVVLSVASVIVLLLFPIGTAWGAYTLWALLHPERLRRITSGGATVPALPDEPRSGALAAESPRGGGAGFVETPRVAG